MCLKRAEESPARVQVVPTFRRLSRCFSGSIDGTAGIERIAGSIQHSLDAEAIPAHHLYNRIAGGPGDENARNLSSCQGPSSLGRLRPVLSVVKPSISGFVTDANT
jgi:hypothetical protein